MNAGDDVHIDWQLIRTIKDKETASYVDYFFIANFYCKDPRHEKRYLQAGEYRGLFRFDKQTHSAELLFPMPGDDGGKRFSRAAMKVLSEFRSNGNWPDRSEYASG